jgi:protein TonB
MQPPVYPPAARESPDGPTGLVRVRVLVGALGIPEEVLLIEGDPILGEAACAAARTARFKPARKNGEPVTVWVEMPIRFSKN